MKKILALSILGLFIFVGAGCSKNTEVANNTNDVQPHNSVVVEQEVPEEPETNFVETIPVYFLYQLPHLAVEDCNLAESIDSLVDSEGNIAETLMRRIFDGPTEDNLRDGFFPHWITKEKAHLFKSVEIKNKVAYVDWGDLREAIPNASTSCGSQSFLEPIRKTLIGLDDVDNVAHSINGSAQTFYDWMQMDCPPYAENTDCRK
jgi:hypothetical protein